VADAESGGELHSGEVVELRKEKRRPLALRNPLQGSLKRPAEAKLHGDVLGGRHGSAGLAGPWEEADDLAPAQLVERDAVSDLVQPRPSVLRLFERVICAIGLDEGVLGEIGRQLRIAQHPDEIGVDLAVMPGEQLLDEGPSRVAIPHAAHSWRTAGDRLGERVEHADSDGQIGTIGNEHDPVDRGRAPNRAMTRRSYVM